MAKLREYRSDLLVSDRTECTRQGYECDFRVFARWCVQAGRASLPASSDTLSLFIADQLQAGLKVTTVDRRYSGVCQWHKMHSHPSPATPECRVLLNNIRRVRKERPEGKKALEIPDLMKISQKLGKTKLAARNRALLVFGLASGLRRSDLSRLNLDDVRISHKGISITVRHSKADQTGVGRTFGIFPGTRVSTDPVRTLRAWLDVRGDEPGPLFTQFRHGDNATLMRLTGKAIHDIVKKSVKIVGLNPKLFGSHSLRAGLITAAAELGASDREIMHASGHKTVAVMQRYIRSTRSFAVRNVLAGAL